MSAPVEVLKEEKAASAGPGEAGHSPTLAYFPWGIII